MAKIELKNIAYSYNGKINAVENINLAFSKEGRYSLLGPSGCGKTTLLKIIIGLLHPQGKVFFDGQDMTDTSVEERDIAMLFQFPVVYPMSVFENLMFPLQRKKISRKEKEKKVLKIAELLEVKSMLNEQANKLSLADAQTVALGRALIKGAGVLLLDEPLSNVEPEKRLALRIKIKRIQEEEKKLYIYVTHDQSEALTLSDEVAVMKDGKVVQFDHKEKIYDEPADLFVGYFIGSPGMNIFKGEFKDDRLDFGDFTLPAFTHLQKSLERHKKIKVGIRPEYLGISKEEKEGWIPFTCDEIEEKAGGVRLLYLRSKNNQNEIKALGSYFDISVKDRLWVKFPDERVKIYDEEGKQIVT